MATPVIESIADDIVSAVQNITTGNGYELDVVKVSRPARYGDVDPIDLLVVVTQGDPTEDDELAAAGNPNAVAWEQPFRLTGFRVQTADDSESIDARLNTLRSDIEKAVMADVTRGGNAINTTLRAPEYDRDSQGYATVSVNIDVSYRVDENDPYDVR